MHVIHNADNMQVSAAAVPEGFAQYIAIWPMRVSGEELCKALVNHDHRLAVRAVGPGEIAASNGRTHRAHVAGTDDVDERTVKTLRGLDPLRKRQTPRAILTKREIVRNTRCFHAGQRADAPDDLLKNHSTLLCAELAVFIVRDAIVVIDFDGCCPFGLESEV